MKYVLLNVKSSKALGYPHLVTDKSFGDSNVFCARVFTEEEYIKYYLAFLDMNILQPIPVTEDALNMLFSNEDAITLCNHLTTK